MLLNAAEQEMTARGCRRIRVCSKATNELAIGYYRAAEFQEREIVFSKDLAPL